METGKGQVSECQTYGLLIECHSEKVWYDNFIHAKEKKHLVVAFFTSKHCNDLTSIVVEDAKNYPRAMFLKADVDEVKNIAKRYQVSTMPTFIFFKLGETQDTYPGEDPSALKEFIDKYYNACRCAATDSA